MPSSAPAGHGNHRARRGAVTAPVDSLTGRSTGLVRTGMPWFAVAEVELGIGVVRPDHVGHLLVFLNCRRVWGRRIWSIGIPALPRGQRRGPISLRRASSTLGPNPLVSYLR